MCTLQAVTIPSMWNFIIVWALIVDCHLILLIKDEKYDLAL